MCLTLDENISLMLSFLTGVDVTKGTVEAEHWDEIYIAKLKRVLYTLGYKWEHTQHGFFIWK